MGVTWSTFGIFESPNTFGTVEAGNFKFDTDMDGSESNEKNAKLSQKGLYGVTWHTYGILGYPNISEWMKLETSNLAHVWTVLSANEKKCKIGSKAVKRWKLQISHIDCRTAVSTDKKTTIDRTQSWMAVSLTNKCKIESKVVTCGQVTNLWNFGTPNISGTV